MTFFDGTHGFFLPFFYNAENCWASRWLVSVILEWRKLRYVHSGAVSRCGRTEVGFWRDDKAEIMCVIKGFPWCDT